MKKFIATIVYCGEFDNFSKIKLVEASKKAVAQKRAEKYAAEHSGGFEPRFVTVEELTPAKEEALNAAADAIAGKYWKIARLHRALQNCLCACEGLSNI